MVIGVLVSGLYEEYTIGICEGIKYIAAQDDINVVIIPGKYLELDLSRKLGGFSEYQYNSSFFYGETSGFDGLIIEMASVSMFASDKNKKRFTSHFQNVPHVYISYEEENSCNIYIDNKVGMMEALEYLYEHGSERFIMIGGPKDNVDAVVRKETFFEFLKSHDLSFDENSYRDGDFVADCTEQIEQLIDNNPGADAFICANDILARNVCKSLQARGIVVGRDISVLGYDDSAAACNNKPSLSSVRADFSQLGIESYKALLKVINGEKIENVKVPTKFILRDSFVSENEFSDVNGSLMDNYHFESIVKKNVAPIQSETLMILKQKFAEMTEKIFNIRDYIGREELMLQYLDDFSMAINSLNYLDYLDVDLCRSALARFYQTQLDRSTTKEEEILLSKAYMHLYREMVNSVYIYYETEIADKRMKQSMQFFSQEAFSFEHGDDSSFEHLLSRSDSFGIKNAFIYIYEEPKYMFQNDEFEVPETLLLKAIMENGSVRILSSAAQRIPRSKILNNEFVHLPKDKTMMLFPLYTNEIMYGIILCDYGYGEFYNSGVFVSQLSSAVRMIATLRAHDTLMSEYEETLQVLKSNNVELDQLSKSDFLTGLVNRRGFKLWAEGMLKTCQTHQQSLMILYVDMNNLKIINDKFGHQDGDFALHRIAKILQETIKENGIVGRIGGDEFACAIPLEKQITEEQIVKQLYGEFEKFNQSSDKEYLVSISAGAYIITPDDNTSLDQALELADEKLYLEKKKRSKNIFKNAPETA